MDRLTGMEVFIRVVELGGFTAAGKATGISTTMVTNHVQALEQRLGARLINRTTRRHSLTDIGMAYYAQCVDILTRIAAAENEARDMLSRPAGRLRVSAPVTLGSHLLMPKLADYLMEYHEVQIELQLNDRIVDLADEGFDVAFRFGNLPDSGLISRPLRGLKRVICAAPSYLDRYGMPTCPDDLIHHNCLAFHYIKPEREWIFEGTEARTVRISGRLTVNNGPALMNAALSGIGIVMLPDYLVAEHLNAGKLVRLFPGFGFPRAPLQLVYLPDRNMTPKMKSFIDFILKNFGTAERHTSQQSN